MILLTRSKDFDRIFRHGSSVSSLEMVLYSFRRPAKYGFPEARVAFCVSKKLFGGAVMRNRVRRRLREIYRLNCGKLDARWDVIILARQGASTAQFAKMERKFLNLCLKLGVLKETQEQNPQKNVQV
ncbi:ribonuclease P protein component [bacterium]|nr:ribonuclease P protein component [bacterium]